LKKKRITIRLLVPAFMLAFLIFPQTGYPAADSIRIKFATLAPDGSTWMKYMRQLDRTLKQKSKGRLGFRLYGGGIAGDELDVLRKIRIGQIHSAVFSGVGIGRILPMVRVLDLPFLFRNNEEVDLVQRGLQENFAQHFRKKGFEFVSWAEVGSVHLFSQEPIRRVEDLSRLKIWTWSGDVISKETFAAMGTNPIPLAVTDVTTALNTKMIDTVYGPPLGVLALQWYTYVKYMTSLPLAHATGAFLVSQKTFEKIPPDLVPLFQQEVVSTMDSLTQELRKQTDDTITALRDGGLTILPMPTGKDLEEFYRVHDKVAKDLTGKVYPREILEQVYRLLKRPH
jgi:TRAP-type C4-dicarboxylate transport system substrate-binding protein